MEIIIILYTFLTKPVIENKNVGMSIEVKKKHVIVTIRVRILSSF